MTSTNSRLSLKLVVDKRIKKVIFAIAEKDFVDFLLSLLTLPVATVVKLLTKNSSTGMVGCLPNLYDGVENLTEDHFSKRPMKGLILNPEVPLGVLAAEIPLISSTDVQSDIQKLDSRPGSPMDDVCPQCGKYIIDSDEDSDDEDEGGFVRGMGKAYTVTDDLIVHSSSLFLTHELLRKHNVKHSRDIDEKVVDVTLDEGLKLLKASLQCDAALTSVFLSQAGE